MTRVDDVPVAGTVVLLRSAAAGVEVLLIRRPDAGSFPGAWVFPGGKVEEGDRRSGADEVDDARRAAVRETAEEVGLAIDDPVVLSRWQPPLDAPVRIRTWFFLAVGPTDDVRAHAAEVVDVAWVTPGEALARHGAGEWTLFPPTWVTLHGLSRCGSVDDALALGGAARHFTTRVVDGDAGRRFEWEGLALEAGALPWRLVEG